MSICDPVTLDGSTRGPVGTFGSARSRRATASRLCSTRRPPQRGARLARRWLRRARASDRAPTSTRAVAICAMAGGDAPSRRWASSAESVLARGSHSVPQRLINASRPPHFADPVDARAPGYYASSLPLATIESTAPARRTRDGSPPARGRQCQSAVIITQSMLLLVSSNIWSSTYTAAFG